MIRHFLVIVTLLIGFQAMPWGPTGHRIVGKIAENYLTKKAHRQFNKILKTETLAEVSNYMDFIKSDHLYDHMSPWHYCTIPDGMTYEKAGTPEEGDVIVTIERLVSELKTKKFTDKDEAFALKCLVHLVGDIHQPLHVGNGNDRGGNDIKVKYFGESSNLHRVWDSEIIDGTNYSYTEYTNWIDHASKDNIDHWQSVNVVDWAYESMKYRPDIYDLPEDHAIGYEYVYKNRHIINQRLLQAGIRLAGILNDIYG